MSQYGSVIPRKGAFRDGLSGGRTTVLGANDRPGGVRQPSTVVEQSMGGPNMSATDGGPTSTSFWGLRHLLRDHWNRHIGKAPPNATHHSSFRPLPFLSARTILPVWIEKSRGTMANFWIFHALLMQTFLSFAPGRPKWKNIEDALSQRR